MDGVAPQRAWLLMAAGSNRGHGGNAGYDDQVDTYYSWDSNVPNHKKVSVGDAVALWDKERLLGVSVIEEITTEIGQKVLNRCPSCSSTRITAPRKTVTPPYRCSKCHHEFSAPRPDVDEVTLFKARYDAAWTSLDGLLDKLELRSLAVHAGDFNAMRPLDWARFSEALGAKHANRAVSRVAARADPAWHPTDVDFAHGFDHALVRVRRGQRQFREHLLQAQGTMCAFTGGAPARVLEAGHLYSYARLGTHAEHGGLMLRRDIHRLFDDGLLAVEPAHLRIDVAEPLGQFPQYARLHGEPLTLHLREPQVDWLDKHWREHRPGAHAGVAD